MSIENHFYDRPAETMSRDQLHSLQSQRLSDIVKHVCNSNDTQRARFSQAGVSPADIRSVEDITKLPFMSKEDMRLGYPLSLSCVDKKDIVEMHMSSGSTGTPVVMPYTVHDLEQWAQCMARCYCMAGARKSDVVQITPSFGLFNGGFGLYHGARQLGLFVIPTGAGNTQRQVKLAKDFQTRIITGVVSYGVRIMEVLAEMKESLPSLEIGIFGAEVFSDAMKKKISTGLGVECFDIYGMTETGGIGTLGQDCMDHSGFHVWEDHYVIEVIDPATHKPVADGQFGELVITSLTRQALPVIRFRTGDLTRITSRETCSCGRTHLKLAPITGRVDDMLIIKGVNFFPSQVEQVLMKIPGVGSNYQIVLEEIDGVRDARVNVEADASVTGYMIEKALKESLGFSPKGDVFPLGQLPRQEGKAQRVFHKTDENK